MASNGIDFCTKGLMTIAVEHEAERVTVGRRFATASMPSSRRRRWFRPRPAGRGAGDVVGEQPGAQVAAPAAKPVMIRTGFVG
jgi:hypothetical protein